MDPGMSSLIGLGQRDQDRGREAHLQACFDRPVLRHLARHDRFGGLWRVGQNAKVPRQQLLPPACFGAFSAPIQLSSQVEYWTYPRAQLERNHG
jgi:hypothetical protein